MQGRPLARLRNCAHELVLCILPLLSFLFCCDSADGKRSNPSRHCIRLWITGEIVVRKQPTSRGIVLEAAALKAPYIWMSPLMNLKAVASE